MVHFVLFETLRLLHKFYVIFIIIIKGFMGLFERVYVRLQRVSKSFKLFAYPVRVPLSLDGGATHDF